MVYKNQFRVIITGFINLKIRWFGALQSGGTGDKKRGAIGLLFLYTDS